MNVSLITNLLMTIQPTEMEFDLDKALEDVPVHMEDTSSRTPPTPSHVLPKLEHRPSGGMVELPSEEEKKLQHFTKLRPRRNKKQHSSKVPVSQTLLAEEAQSKILIIPKSGILQFTCKTEMIETRMDYTPSTHL